MIKNAEIFISKKDRDYKVRVVGRATFTVGSTLRNLATRIQNDPDIRNISIDMKGCTGMDSTFMGILAMLALKLKKQIPLISIINPGDANKKLFHGLGLNKLFTYVDIDENSGEAWDKEEIKAVSFKENAETVLEAHKTLMESDSGNVEKFKNVVKEVEKELNK